MKLWICIISSTLLFSCVPLKKYTDLEKRSRECEELTRGLKSENESLSVDKAELGARLEVLEDSNKKMMSDSARWSRDLRQLQADNERDRKLYAELQEAQDNLLKGNARETTKLLMELQSTQNNLQKRDDELKKAEAASEAKRRDLESLKTELDRRNARLTELESVLHRKDSVTNALRTKVSNALMGFEGDGLSVKMQNGKVYVSLEEKLLFQSGSTVVDPKGVNALKRLAKVLEQNPDINIMIEGHTDDVPYRATAGGIQDNWDLSVKRATSIVRILLEGTTIDPKRLVAAGRGEFMPVDPAKTSPARQKNRRTEIILTPRLDELFRILETN
jgi:chemotaxis protein MotB